MLRCLFRLSAVFAFSLLLVVVAIPAQAQLDFSACAETVPQAEIDPECLALMEAFPAPVVIPVTLDITTLSMYSFWHVVGEDANVFSAPGGNVVRQIPTGFNFVQVIDDSSVEGWVQIESGEWMRAADVQYHEASYFRGVRILNGLATSFGWILGDLVTRQYPGASQNRELGRVLLRYDLVNIFATTVDEDGWTWYMVGPDQWIEQRMLAAVSKIDRSEDVLGRWVAINLYEQTLVAYEDDTPVFATLVSTGLPGTETTEGLFQIWARLDRDRMSGFVGAPNGYDLQSVPWVMYFNESASLHGTYWHDVFGYRSSRGCVNLSISDANFLYHWFGDETPNEDGEIVNYVYVYSSGEYRSAGS